MVPSNKPLVEQEACSRVTGSTINSKAREAYTKNVSILELVNVASPGNSWERIFLASVLI
jgi:hypothetical protein